MIRFSSRVRLRTSHPELSNAGPLPEEELGEGVRAGAGVAGGDGDGIGAGAGDGPGDGDGAERVGEALGGDTVAATVGGAARVELDSPSPLLASAGARGGIGGEVIKPPGIPAWTEPAASAWGP